MHEGLVREITPPEYSIWDSLNLGSPQGSIFLRSDFLRMLCDTDPSYRNLNLLGYFDDAGELKAGQAVIFRRFLDATIGHDSYFFYNGPLLPPISNLPRASFAEAYSLYLSPLAVELSRRFPGFSFDTHPTLSDLRPVIRLGWKVDLQYTHIWNLEDPRELISRMRQGERKKIHKAQKLYSFQQEKWKVGGQEFLLIHQESISKHGWKPDARWNNLLSQRAQWMEDHDMFMMTTARKPDNHLDGALMTILGYPEHTAYLWFVGYEPESAENGIVPALYNEAVKALPPDFIRVDMSKAKKVSLANFKDYLGTDLVPYYTITSPGRWEQIINSTHHIRRNISKVIKSIKRSN
jgi:hypothetical protein